MTIEDLTGQLEVETEILNLRQPVVVFLSKPDGGTDQWRLDVMIGAWSPRRVQDFMDAAAEVSLGPSAEGGDRKGLVVVGRGRWFHVASGWDMVGRAFQPPEPVEVWMAFENINSRQRFTEEGPAGGSDFFMEFPPDEEEVEREV